MFMKKGEKKEDVTSTEKLQGDKKVQRQEASKDDKNVSSSQHDCDDKPGATTDCDKKSIIHVYNHDRKSPVKPDLVATEIQNQESFTL